jgi:uncharacterized damage-inducible protein DinB
MRKKIIAKYRDNGAVGALLDEYERAIKDFVKVVKTVKQRELTTIVDAQTADEDCRSIQTILAHVVYAGYGYATAVRSHEGEQIVRPEKQNLMTCKSYLAAIDQMFAYNVQLFEDYPNLKLEEFENDKKIHFAWGQCFDVDQLFEHAICHILRHRRQIERFLLRLRAANK